MMVFSEASLIIKILMGVPRESLFRQSGLRRLHRRYRQKLARRKRAEGGIAVVPRSVAALEEPQRRS